MAEQVITSMLLRTQLPSSTPRPPVAASRLAVGVLGRSTALAPQNKKTPKPTCAKTGHQLTATQGAHDGHVKLLSGSFGPPLPLPAAAAEAWLPTLDVSRRTKLTMDSPPTVKALLLPCWCPLGRYRGPRSGLLSLRPWMVRDHRMAYGRVTAKDFLLLTATDRPSRHPGAPFGHGNASAHRQRSGHSRLAPPRPRMLWRTKVYLAMAPQGGLALGAAGGCRGWAETQSASSFSVVA
eukprot:COSAG01_NODE_565_length_15436_cov_64.116581_10_plen_237_part_00